MPRGQPDFGMYAIKEVSASISDMGEVAARLGSIVVYDKRGDVVSFDNFEEPVISWYRLGDVAPPPTAGVYAILDNTNAKSGSQSLKMHTPAVAGAAMYMENFATVSLSKRLGVEISFAEYTVTGISPFPIHCLLRIDLIYYDGVNRYSAVLKIVPALGQIIIEDGEAEDVLIATFKQFISNRNLFYTTKLVADFGTGKYIRLLFSNHEYDISGYSMYTVEDARAPFLQTRLKLENVGAAANDIWLDDFIYTLAEP